MRRPFIFLFLFALIVPFRALSQVPTNSVNIVYNIANFLGQPQVVTSVKIQDVPTNSIFGQNLEGPFFPLITRATTPSLTNGTFTLSNAIANHLYKTTLATFDGQLTYWILAPSGLPSGTTIYASSNTVAPTAPSVNGQFSYTTVASDARYLTRQQPSQTNYVATAIDTNGDYTWQLFSAQAFPLGGPANIGNQNLTNGANLGLNGTLTANKLNSDSGQVTSDGSGNLTVQHNLTSGNIHNQGVFTSDNGGIFSDGLGDLTLLAGTLTIGNTNPAAAVAAIGVTASGQLTANNVPGSGGQNQTPWAQTINMAGQQATNGNSATYTNLLKGGNLNATKSITNAGPLVVSGQSILDNGAIVSDGSGHALIPKTVGTFVASNAASGVVLNLGINAANSENTFGSPGQESRTTRLADFGWDFVDSGNSANLEAWGYQGHYGLAKIDGQGMVFTGPANDGDGVPAANLGAPASMITPDIVGNGSGLLGLPVRGPEIWSAKKHPWLGVQTDVTGEDDNANFALFEACYTNLPNISKYFNTSQVNAALSPYGIQTWVWGDQGWGTNRQVNGQLRFNPSILSINGATNWSELNFIIHTNGMKVSYAIYRSSIPYNHLNGDTERVFQTNQDWSYPSQVTVGAPFWSEITPETVLKDIAAFYTNGADEITFQDTQAYQGINGYEQQLSLYDYAVIYPQLQSGGTPIQNTYWRNWTNGVPLSTFIGPGYSGTTSNQMVIGAFVNRPSLQTPYMINDLAFDEGYPQTGTDNGLSVAMSYARSHRDYTTNWPPASFMPIFTDITGDNNNSSWTKANYTNFYSVSEMMHANTAVDVNTNTWTWNTNQNFITNCPLFLTTWMDNTLAQPQWVFDDGTNGLMVRNIDNGAFLVLAFNQSASTSNICQTISGFDGIPTNYIFTATNVMSGTAFGSGYFTNLFSNAVPSISVNYVKLTPYAPQVAQVNGQVVADASGALTAQTIGAANGSYITNNIHLVNSSGELVTLGVVHGGSIDNYMSFGGPGFSLNGTAMPTLVLGDAFRASGQIMMVDTNSSGNYEVALTSSNGFDFGNTNLHNILNLTVNGSITLQSPNQGTSIATLGVDSVGRLTTNGVTGGSGQNQTPILSDINGAGFNDTNWNTVQGTNGNFQNITVTSGTVTNLTAQSFLTSTNVYTGNRSLDFSHSDYVTNCAGSLIFTNIINFSNGYNNSFIIHCFANGADRSIFVSNGITLGPYGATGVISNAQVGCNLLVECEAGFTNIFQLPW